MSLFYEDSTRTRISFETAAKRLSCRRHDASRVGVVVGEEGREPARHGADDRGDGHRRDRRAPPRRRRAAPGRRAGSTPASSTPATAATSTPPRRCSTRSRCAATAARSLDGLPRRDRRRHPQLARRAQRRRRRSHALGARRHARRAADAAAASRSTAGRSTVSHDLDDVLPERRRRLPAAHPARAPATRRCSRRLREYTARCGLTVERAARLKPDTLVMHPGPDEPRRRDRRRGRRGPARRSSPSRSPTASRCAWPCCTRCSARERRLPDGARDPRRARRRRDRRARRPTCSSRDGHVVEVGAGLARRRATLDAVGLRRRARASSTCTCTCASRAARTPRRSRPARAPPRSAASPRSSRCRTPTPPLDDPAVVAVGARGRARGRRATCTSPGCITEGPRRARSSRRWASCYALGVRIFTDDGDVRRRRRGDAARARVRARRCPGAVVAQHAEDPALAGGGHMHEGAWSSRLGIPGRPAAAEVVDRRPRPACSRELTGAPRATSCTCRPRARSSSCARPRPRAAGHRRGARRTTSRSPTRACASLRPGVQGEPAAAHATPTSPRSRPGSPTARSTRSPPTTRPHPTEAKERPFEEAPPGMLGLETALAVALTRARRAGRADARAQALARAVVAPGARSPGSTRRPRRPDRAGRAREPLRDRPRRARWVVDADRLASRSRNTPVRRADAHRPGPPHDPARRARRRRRRGAAMSERDDGSDACSCSPTATTVRGRGDRRARPATASPTGEVVFNTALSGYQEILTDPSYAGPDHHVHVPAHRQLRRQRRRRREPRAPFCRGVVVRDLAPAPEQLARDRATSTASSRATASPGITGIDTRRLTRHLRDAGALPGAFGTDEAAVRGRGDARDGDRRPRPRRRRSPPPRRTSSGDADAPFRVVAYDFGIKRTILRHLVRRGLPRRGRARRRRPRPTCSPASPTACSSRTAPAIPAAVAGARRRRCAALARRGAGVRHLPRPPDPRASRSARDTYKLPFGHHGAQPPGAPRGDRPGRDHEPEPQLRGRRRHACPAAPTSPT